MKQELLAWTKLSPDEVLKKIASSRLGLTNHEADKRLQQYGPNKISSQSTSALTIFKRQFTSPFLYLLFAASLISFLLREFDDGLMILVFIAIDVVLGFYQEYKSERTVALLQKYIEHKITTLRDGKEQVIEISKLVPGDIIKLVPGDAIPADIRFLETTDLLVNESVVTGESVPVGKSDHDIGLCATTILSGEALAVVTATGNQTSYGDIATLTNKAKRVSTFELRIERISKFTLIIVSVTLVCMFLFNLIIHQDTNMIELAIFSVALAVSVIPEALPVVTTFSLSLGALHLAKKHVVVKRLSAIEDVGSIEILCSDKTGTLTENKLKLIDTISEDIKKLLLYAGAIAQKSQKKSYHGNNSFDEAILNAADGLKTSFEIVKEIPFDPERKRTTKIVKHEHQKLLITMGAPENVLAITTLEAHKQHELLEQVSTFGKEGKRVLAVAYTEHEEEKQLTYLGLLTFEDPIKPTTKHAITKAEELGVQIKIVTGDGKEVAGHVAHEIGLITDPSQVITGEELDRLSDKEQREAVLHYHVFARVTPEQKYHIIELLKTTHAVGFLGEGINDAPALKIANVAMVVAEASAIARDASDIVLLKKNLSVIVDGIMEGRRVFANTSKYILATLSANFGNFFAVATSSLLMSSLPLLPIHILLLNLLSDFPMISVSTDHVDDADIKRPSQFQMHRFVILMLLLGMVSTFFDFVFFGFFVRQGVSVLQSAWFMGSILTELLFLFSIRTNRFFLHAKRPSMALLALTAIAAIATIIIPNFSVTQQLFHFSPVSSSTMVMVLSIVVLYFCATEGVKLLYMRFEKDKK